MGLRNRCRPRLVAKQERLMRLHAAVVAKTRKTPTPHPKSPSYMSWVGVKMTTAADGRCGFLCSKLRRGKGNDSKLV